MTVLAALGLSAAFYLQGVEAKSAYVAPSILLLSVVIASVWRRVDSANVMLMAWSVLVGLYAVEGALPLLQIVAKEREKLLKARYAAEHGRTYDPRFHLTFMKDMRAQGKLIYPAFPSGAAFKRGTGHGELTLRGPDNEPLFPLGSISSVLTMFGNEIGEFLVYESDKYGFHNPPGIWGLPKLDIAAVGDSFTHGAAVPSHQNFVAIIREQFPRTVNLGHGGNGPLAELGSIMEYLPARRPQLVLWFYWRGNDLIEDIHREKQSPALMNYLEDPPILQNLVLRQAIIDKGLSTYADSLISSFDAHAPKRRTSNQLFGFLTLKALRVRLWRMRHPPESDFETFEAVLSKAQLAVAAWDGKLVLVYLTHKRADEAHRENILRICSRLGVSIIDLTEEYPSSDPRTSGFYYPYAGHYTIEGNRAVADVVLREIGKRKLLE
jgi:hypothetical protein